MLLLFRFLLVFLGSVFRSRLDINGESVVRFTALPTDCDLNYHVNSGRYLSFMDAARMDLLARAGVLRKLLRRGWRPVMGGGVLRFRRSVLPFERFDVRSRLLGWDEKWFYFEHIIEKDGKFCVSGIVRTLVRSKSGNVAMEDVIALTGAKDATSPPLPDSVLRWREMENAR